MPVFAATILPPPAHTLTGTAGWTDEIISFGFIVGIIIVLMIMSRLGRRKRLRDKDKDQE